MHINKITYNCFTCLNSCNVQVSILILVCSEPFVWVCKLELFVHLQLKLCAYTSFFTFSIFGSRTDIHRTDILQCLQSITTIDTSLDWFDSHFKRQNDQCVVQIDIRCKGNKRLMKVAVQLIHGLVVTLDQLIKLIIKDTWNTKRSIYINNEGWSSLQCIRSDSCNV